MYQTCITPPRFSSLAGHARSTIPHPFFSPFPCLLLHPFFSPFPSLRPNPFSSHAPFPSGGLPIAIRSRGRATHRATAKIRFFWNPPRPGPCTARSPSECPRGRASEVQILRNHSSRALLAIGTLREAEAPSIKSSEPSRQRISRHWNPREAEHCSPLKFWNHLGCTLLIA